MTLDGLKFSQLETLLERLRVKRQGRELHQARFGWIFTRVDIELNKRMWRGQYE